MPVPEPSSVSLPPVGAQVRLDKTGDVGYVLGYAHLASMPSVRVAWEDGTRATAWPDDLTVVPFCAACSHHHQDSERCLCPQCGRPVNDRGTAHARCEGQR